MSREHRPFVPSFFFQRFLLVRVGDESEAMSTEPSRPPLDTSSSSNCDNKDRSEYKDMMSYATFVKYNHINAYMSTINVREKRNVFNCLRESENDDTFLPHLGITSGCFCVWQILNDGKRPRKTRVPAALKRKRALDNAMTQYAVDVGGRVES
jgi:hypothetical protein